MTSALAILRLLDLVVAGLTIAPVVMARYRHHRALIENMIEEDRDPTEAEWDELNLSISQSRNELHDVPQPE